VLTVFTTAKPFKGHNAIIQRNALQSWKLLHPDAEIILFGDDDGAAEVCLEFGLHHEPYVERNEFGANRVDYMFAKAQEIARYGVLCFLNCDIILLPDFSRAIERVKAAHSAFLAIGRRWDTPITQPIDFSSPNWPEETRRKALAANHQQTEWFIDYFAFSRGFFCEELPPLAVGRIYWDNWMVWKGCQSQKPVVDISPVVVAVHQNHDYSHHPMGKQGVWGGPEAERNFQLAGGSGHLRNIADATEILQPRGLRPNRRRHWASAKRGAAPAGRFLLYKVWNPLWFFFLGITRPLRSALGWRAAAVRRPREKS
jgi:hypothetical protein